MGSVAKNGLNNYVKQLQEHPLRTKVITAGVLSGISDIVSQKLTGIQKIQFKRVLLKVILGAGYLGPFGHYFHIALEKIFKGKKDSKTVAKKVLIEQLTSSPLNNLIFMIYFGLVIEGQPWANVKARVRKGYPSVQYASWMFWPVVGVINYKFMPLHFRVVFHSLVAFCWGIFLNLRARPVALIKP
ncbi:unnamed protein product [Trifolium pratense]|uniref:Uncharacterized protein n=1 Tax=Trifolium pratense TaxID=57577 RepID=A0ACB0KNM9_TRIPR|nr:unnamed protein product [Trifolium pratense]